jgi:hypothetical protein
METPASTPQARRRLVHYAVMVHGSIFVCVGLFVLYSTISSARRDRSAAASWRQTECTITSVSPWYAKGGRHSPPRLDRVIQFRCSVDGQQIVSNAMDLRSYWGLHGTGDRDYVEFASRYHAGQTALCFYDPERPERAVLTLEIPAPSYSTGYILGVLFSLVGAAIVWFAWIGFGIQTR